MILMYTSYNYNPGDTIASRRYNNIPGAASVVVSQGATIYSINGSTSLAPANGSGNAVGYRSMMTVLWYRTS